MDYLVDILKLSIPALLVLWASYNVMHQVVLREEKKQRFSQSKHKQNITLPMQLKAYERLTLFLERIAPQQIIRRTQDAQMQAGELQMVLLKTIQQEYEHNLTQQLYISDEAWQAILFTKESVIQLVNSGMSVVKSDAPAFELAKVIIEAYHSADTTPTEVAIKQLKEEVNLLLA